MKYNDLIERALTVLRNDTVLAEKVNEFRFGELDNDVAEQYPAIHVLTYRPYQSGDSIGTGRSGDLQSCLLYTSPSPRDRQKSRMQSSA